MGLMDDLGSGSVAVDTAILISFIEAAPGRLHALPDPRILQLSRYAGRV